jgi:nitroreductase
MEVFEAVKKRRTIRKFQRKGVGHALLEKCVEAARLAPSAMNAQPLEFIAIDSEGLLAKVFECTAWAGSCPRAGPEKGEEPTAYIAVLLDKKADPAWGRIDAGLAVENILLTALEQGIASCCLGALNREKLSSILKIPPQFEPLLLVALGYPKQESKALDSAETAYRLEGNTVVVPKKPLEKALHWNEY